MSEDNPLEKSLGKPLPRKSEVERQLGRPLSRTALPGPPSDLDDEPMPVHAHSSAHPPAHWPDEEAAASPPAGEFTVTEGELLQTLDYYFPLLWAAGLLVICYIGIYYAVDQIWAHNPLPPNFGM